MTATTAAVGSVLPAPDPGQLPTRDSVWARWTDGFANVAAFRTARGAFAALLRFNAIRRVWLPAYVCEAVPAAVVHAGAEARWYGPGERLDGGAAVLQRDLRPGDAVLAVDYFGRSAPEETRALADHRRDVLWIEDRAQALAPGRPAFGDVLLYSPRKLFGVADGGLLISNLPLPAADEATADDGLWRANEGRAGDPDGLAPESWFPAFKAREARFAVDAAPMSRRTQEVLAATLFEPEAAARRANWRVLAEHLSDLALWPESEVEFAPLAYPVLVRDAAAVSARLAKRRIWCARHWANPPSPPHAFPEAHALAGRCLSVPLDPRYGPDDMARAAEAVRAAAV